MRYVCNACRLHASHKYLQSEIPPAWRAAELSKVELPSEDERNTLPGCYYRDTDFCYLDDLSEGDYVDLTANPERFTGYTGPSARRVWSSIYEENCFGMSETALLAPTNPTPGVLKADSGDSSRTCLEKRVYYKIISGTLFTSITEVQNTDDQSARPSCKHFYPHML